jgi:hypothetical protein
VASGAVRRRPHGVCYLTAVGAARASTRAGRPGRQAQLGQKQGRGPRSQENSFSFYFQSKQPLNPYFEHEKGIFRRGPKTKVVQNFVLFNFAKRSKVRF